MIWVYIRARPALYGLTSVLLLEMDLFSQLKKNLGNLEVQTLLQQILYSVKLVVVYTELFTVTFWSSL